MGLFSGLSAWFGNSQAFALNSIADDNFALENLTYAVTHHTTAGIPHLYTLTNLYRSYGHGSWNWCSSSLIGGDLAGFTKSKGQESQPPQHFSKSL